MVTIAALLAATCQVAVSFDASVRFPPDGGITFDAGAPSRAKSALDDFPLDVPRADLDGGIVELEWGRATSGGLVPEGYWLSHERVLVIGRKLTEPPPVCPACGSCLGSTTTAFAIGAVVGLVGSLVLVIVITR